MIFQRILPLIAALFFLLANSSSNADSLFGPARLVSKAANTQVANAASTRCRISANGQYLVFQSTASNLTSNANNGKSHIFVNDRLSALSTLVSQSSGAVQANDDSSNASISSVNSTQGFVVFQSKASNLVSDDSNSVYDIFLRDIVAGTTSRVSKTLAGIQNSFASLYPSISESGNSIAFLSYYDTAPMSDGGSLADVFVVDRLTSAIERVNVGPGGVQADDQTATGWPAISADGNVVTFGSFAQNLVLAGGTTISDIYVHDRTLDSTERVSIAPGGQRFDTDLGAIGTIPLGPGSISADGRYVAFGVAYSLATPDEIYIRDRQLATTTLIATLDHTPSGPQGISWAAFGNSTGRYLAFFSPATNPLAGSGTNGGTFLFDMNVTPQTIASYELLAEGGINPCISSDGKVVGFDAPSGLSSSNQIFIREVDQCPSDADKESPGQCGCGVADIDSNADGIANCLDPTPTPTATSTATPPSQNIPSPTPTVTPTPTLKPGQLPKPPIPIIRVSKQGVVTVRMPKRKNTKYQVAYTLTGKKTVVKSFTKNKITLTLTAGKYSIKYLIMDNTKKKPAKSSYSDIVKFTIKKQKSK